MGVRVRVRVQWSHDHPSGKFFAFVSAFAQPLLIALTLSTPHFSSIIISPRCSMYAPTPNRTKLTTPIQSLSCMHIFFSASPVLLPATIFGLVREPVHERVRGLHLMPSCLGMDHCHQTGIALYSNVTISR